MEDKILVEAVTEQNRSEDCVYICVSEHKHLQCDL